MQLMKHFYSYDKVVIVIWNRQRTVRKLLGGLLVNPNNSNIWNSDQLVDMTPSHTLMETEVYRSDVPSKKSWLIPIIPHSQ